MGQALEWLGRDGCRSVFAELVAVDGRRSTESRLWACCPFHQERTPSFKYEPEKDRFHCFGCKQSGDLIDLYEHLNGYAPGDGFMPFRDRYAPDGKLDPRRDKPAAKRPAGPPPWTPSEVRDVAPQWSERAESFVAHSQERLAANAEALAWLAGRGITPETAQVCRLGWNDKDKYPPRSRWGLPVDLKPSGKERPIWLPEGLVIPWVRAGRVVKIKIRRPRPDLGPERLRGLKYYGILGSAGCFSVYGRPEAPVAVVVESELDAVLLWQECRKLGAVILAAPAGNKPDIVETALLRNAEVVLVSLDVAKPVTEGEKPETAGPMASAWWLSEFPNAIRRPVPPSMGKDHGEAVAAGLSIREWYLAALPHHVLRQVQPASVPVPAPAPAPAPEPIPKPSAPVRPPSTFMRRNPLSRRSRLDGPGHVATYRRGRAWVLEHLDELLAKGWTRRTLLAAGRYRYPIGSWGLAWSSIWGKSDVISAEIKPDGTVAWTVQECRRQVVLESRPVK